MSDYRHHMEEGRVVVTRVKYRLNMVNENGAKAEARGPNREELLNLCQQLEAMNYTFSRLELVTEGQ